MKTVKLGDVCDLMTGGTPSRSEKEYFDNGTIPWLVSGDIHKDEITSCDGIITELGLKNSNARLLPINSIMIALNGQGKTRATVAMLRIEATCNQSLVSIYPKDDKKVLPEYIYWNLKGRYDELRRLTGDDGNDRRGLNMIIIRNIDIPDPPSIEEQREVVERLDAAFKKIDRAIDLTLKNTANSSALYSNTVEKIFMQMMGKNVRISDLMKLEYGKPLNKNERKTDGKYSVYGANGVKDKSDKFFYDKPSIIVGRKGSAGEVTKVCEPFWPLDVTYYVTHDETETLIDFLFYVLKSLNLPSLAKGVKPGINRNEVYALPFKLPSIDEQRVIVKEIQSLQKLDNDLRNAYSRRIFILKSLKQSMLQQAFSGDGVQ